LRWHDLRHTFASRLAMANVSVLAIQKLMRHQTLSQTLKYAHLAPSRLHEDAEATCASATRSVTATSTENQRLD
jgi:site-specific recombinase XerD